MKKFFNFIDKIRIMFSDIIAKYVATWKFVFLYTIAMITWIILHVYGVLSIDSTDFIKYNLFLSWAAGIQASVILMASNRETEKDRQNILKSLELDEKTLEFATILHKSELQNISSIKKIASKLNEMIDKIDKLEEIISLMENEEEEVLNEKTTEESS